jgi:hypothetical protein
MPLGAVRIEDQDGRRPLRAEALEDLRLLLDVGPVRDEALRDER